MSNYYKMSDRTLKSRIHSYFDTFRNFSDRNLLKLRNFFLSMTVLGAGSYLYVRGPQLVIRYSSVSSLPIRLLEKPRHNLIGRVLKIGADSRIQLEVVHIPNWYIISRLNPSLMKEKPTLNLVLAGVHNPSTKGLDYLSKHLFNKTVSFDILSTNQDTAEVLVRTPGFLRRKDLTSYLLKKRWGEACEVPGEGFVTVNSEIETRLLKDIYRIKIENSKPYRARLMWERLLQKIRERTIYKS
jgi:hypothetical protein